jgi:hypothetical protein
MCLFASLACAASRSARLAFRSACVDMATDRATLLEKRRQAAFLLATTLRITTATRWPSLASDAFAARTAVGNSNSARALVHQQQGPRFRGLWARFSAESGATAKLASPLSESTSRLSLSSSARQRPLEEDPRPLNAPPSRATLRRFAATLEVDIRVRVGVLVLVLVLVRGWGWGSRDAPKKTLGATLKERLEE